MYRRRGPRLEEAILDAAWAEITKRGYVSLTLESVAKLAGTSRPVLSRRWKTRSALAIAALARYVARHPIAVPDMGNVRDDVANFLRQMSDRARPDMIQLVFDMYRDLAAENSNLGDVRAELRARSADADVMRIILERGVARGEIAAERLTPRVVALPMDLARNEILMTYQALSDEAIAEIVNQVFLPLVRK